MRSVPKRDDFHVVTCPDEDTLQEILHFNGDFLTAASSMTEEAVVSRFRRCHSAFQCIVHDSALRGFFILLPVTSECVDEIRAGRIQTGRQISLEHIVTSMNRVEGVYLSVVCARGPRAQAATVAAVIARLRDFCRSHHLRYIFVRATTGPGARSLQRLTGMDFAADGRIHEIDLTRYPAITA